VQNCWRGSLSDVIGWNWLSELSSENQEMLRVQQVNCPSNEETSSRTRYCGAWYCLHTSVRNRKQSFHRWNPQRLGRRVNQKATRLSRWQASQLPFGPRQQRPVFQRICILRVRHPRRSLNGNADHQRNVSAWSDPRHAWRNQDSQREKNWYLC
jgi:hypothetical protein